MSLSEALCSLCIYLSMLLILCLAVTGLHLATASSGPDQSSLPVDQREPIIRGTSAHSGNGIPWSWSYPAYRGWPYGQ